MGEKSAGVAPAELELDIVVLLWSGRKLSVRYSCDGEESGCVWTVLGVRHTQLLYVNLVHSVLHAASTSPC